MMKMLPHPEIAQKMRFHSEKIHTNIDGALFSRGNEWDEIEKKIITKNLSVFFATCAHQFEEASLAESEDFHGVMEKPPIQNEQDNLVPRMEISARSRFQPERLVNTTPGLLNNSLANR
jgi:hypothetical protein